MSGNIFLEAADATACAILNEARTALVNTAVVSSLVPGGQKVGLIAMTGAMVAGYAHELGCPSMELGVAPDPPPEGKGCQEVDGGAQLWRYIPDNQQDTRIDAGMAAAVKIVGTDYSPGNPDQGLSGLTAVYWEDVNGDLQNSRSGLPAGTSEPYYYLIPNPGSTCVRDDHAPLAPTPDVPAQTYIDQTTNCTYNVKLVGAFADRPESDAHLVYQIESADQSGASVRASGGVIGGCYLSPHIYVHRPGGGGPNGPWPPIPPIPVPPTPPGPDGGKPWWADAVVAAATGALTGIIANEIAKAFDDNLEAGTFTLTAPCDYTEEGDNKSYFFPFPKSNFQKRVIDHQMAILQTLQYHLNSKTPTCSSNAKPPPEGEWVTTRWESEEVMPHSGHRLRKQFRYRSKSGLPLQERSAYWEWFQWQSGDVCVIHKGAWWGTPQVWAASEEEGKRVIRFAAGEAGLDPDQVGQWVISSSDSPRYGMSGTMKIRLYKGFPWITSRGGASYPMALAKVHDP